MVVAPPTPSCSEEIFQERVIRLCPDAPAVEGLLVKSVFIDDVPLAVLESDGRYTTALNQYVSHDSLQAAARDAVTLLGGAKLMSLQEQADQSQEVKEKIEEIGLPCP